jgi:hypothetical protein
MENPDQAFAKDSAPQDVAAFYADELFLFEQILFLKKNLHFR